MSTDSNNDTTALEGEVVNKGQEYSLTVAAKILNAFENDYNVSQACQYAGVSRVSYYNWLKQHEEFAAKVEEAKNMPMRRAREVVIEAINNGDASLAFKYLQARDPAYKAKLEVDPAKPLDETRDKIKDFLNGPTDYSPEAEPNAPGAEPTAAPTPTDPGAVAATPPDIS